MLPLGGDIVSVGSEERYATLMGGLRGGFIVKYDFVASLKSNESVFQAKKLVALKRFIFFAQFWDVGAYAN